MFIMLDVRACGLSATEFAERLLETEGVSVLPIEAFGPSGAGHVRIALAADEDDPGRGLPSHRALRREPAEPRPRGALRVRRLTVRRPPRA